MWGISALIGPPIGALLTGTIGWRYVFWVNLPALALMLALGYLGPARPPAPGLAPTRRSRCSAPR